MPIEEKFSAFLPRFKRAGNPEIEREREREQFLHMAAGDDLRKISFAFHPCLTLIFLFFLFQFGTRVLMRVV
jgi:hypothetical protein